jgi:ribosomal protein L19
MFDYTKWDKNLEAMPDEELREINKMIVDILKNRKMQKARTAMEDMQVGDTVMINSDVKLSKRAEIYRNKKFTIVKFARKNIHIRYTSVETGKPVIFSIASYNVHKV